MPAGGQSRAPGASDQSTYTRLVVSSEQPLPLPRAEYALLGRSGTEPAALPGTDTRTSVVLGPTAFPTPFGSTPDLEFLTLRTDSGELRRLVFVRPVPAPAPSLEPGLQGREHRSLALFWALREVGVVRIVAESGAASITQHFHPRDLVIPHDFIDFTPQRSGWLSPGHSVSMREPFCPDIREVLWQRSRRFAAEKATRAFNRAIHASVEGPRAETAAEVAALARLGGDVISQGVTPDVYLAREIGACFGTVEMVLNYAEGVRPEWDFELLRAIIREGAEELGKVALDALAALPTERTCLCAARPSTPEGGTAERLLSA